MRRKLYVPLKPTTDNFLEYGEDDDDDGDTKPAQSIFQESLDQVMNKMSIKQIDFQIQFSLKTYFQVEYLSEEESTHNNNSCVNDHNYQQKLESPEAHEEASLIDIAEEAPNEIIEAATFVATPQINNSSDDEFLTFGKSIGLQLKQMPINIALKCQLKIQEILTTERIKSIANSSY